MLPFCLIYSVTSENIRFLKKEHQLEDFRPLNIVKYKAIHNQSFSSA